jgi:uncharacterized repeat protein (TIGR03833 family)
VVERPAEREGTRSDSWRTHRVLITMTYTVGSRYPKPGDRVKLIQKKDYESGILTEGVVGQVLTRSEIHPRGHKVRLTNGSIGRVQEFVDIAEPTVSLIHPKENVVYVYTGEADASK